MRLCVLLDGAYARQPELSSTKLVTFFNEPLAQACNWIACDEVQAKKRWESQSQLFATCVLAIDVMAVHMQVETTYPTLAPNRC